jgi:hypothetical protein
MRAIGHPGKPAPTLRVAFLSLRLGGRLYGLFVR